MLLRARPVPDPGAVLPAANAVAKLGAAAALMTAAFVSVDLVTSLLVLGTVAAAFPFGGLQAGSVMRMGGPLLAAAAVIGLVNLALATGPNRGWEQGLALGARVAAIAAAGVLFVATTEPVDLAGGLVQQLHLSPRFAIGALAALRLAPALAAEWTTLLLARRARGVDAGRSPLALVQLTAGALFGLLAGTIRRATRPGLAMDARGFGSRPCRTVARPQHMRGVDWALLLTAVALAMSAVAVSVALGTWRPLLG